MGWADTQNIDEAIAAIKQVAATFAITLGAGGAFIYGITHNRSFAEAGDLASRAASQVVADYGPRLSFEAHRTLLA